MSHFIGIVFLNDNFDTLEDMLAPYDEQTDDADFLSFDDQTEFIQMQYESADYLTNEEREKYDTLDKFATEYYGMKKEQGEDGTIRYGYILNTNAKWDWFEIGGRWGGFLSDKDGEKHDILDFDAVDWDRVSSPFCYIDEGGDWHEKGWSAEDDTQGEWDDTFKAYIRDLQSLSDTDRAQITCYAIDFHI